MLKRVAMVAEQRPASVPWNTQSCCKLESDPVQCGGGVAGEQCPPADARRTGCNAAAT